MMGKNGVDDFRALAVFPGNLGAQGYVRTFLVVVNCLTQVMQEASALCNLHIAANFRGHQTSQMADFDGV